MPSNTGLQQRAAGSQEGSAPLHVAIIMDGNGRWAKRRGLPRTLGHREGVKALKRTVEGAPDCGVGILTVFGFSTENWRRPVAEVSELMNLLKAYVESDLERLAREGVRVRVLGRRTGLRPDILEVIERAEARTRDNERFELQVAFNPAFLMDPLKALAKDEVFFEVKDEVSPGVFKTLESFICVIMPVRLS